MSKRLATVGLITIAGLALIPLEGPHARQAGSILAIAFLASIGLAALPELKHAYARKYQ